MFLVFVILVNHFRARPPSPGAKFFNSVDASNTVNYVISQVTNREIQTCIQALAQVSLFLLHAISLNSRMVPCCMCIHAIRPVF